MASRLLNPTLFHLRTPFFASAAAALGVSTALYAQHRSRSTNLLRLDASATSVNPKDWSFSQYQNDARAPILKKDGGLNARAVRQISSGSIIGLVAGLGLSVFSKPLVLIVGLLVAGVYTLENYGIHIIPYRQLQGYVKGVDVRSAVQDNLAFKISAGTMFALSAFAQL